MHNLHGRLWYRWCYCFHLPYIYVEKETILNDLFWIWSSMGQQINSKSWFAHGCQRMFWKRIKHHRTFSQFFFVLLYLPSSLSSSSLGGGGGSSFSFRRWAVVTGSWMLSCASAIQEPKYMNILSFQKWLVIVVTNCIILGIVFVTRYFEGDLVLCLWFIIMMCG